MGPFVRCLFLVLLGMLVETVVIEQFSTSSKIQCCTACSRNANCKGVVYGNTSFLCQLQDARNTFPMWFATNRQNVALYMYRKDPPVNLAQFYVDVQLSGPDGNSKAHRAIDGISDTCVGFREKTEAPYWFTLDLNATYLIGRIVISNTITEMSDFTVTVDDALCCNYESRDSRSTVSEVQCNNGPMHGKTIKVIRNWRPRIALQICEIEIFQY